MYESEAASSSAQLYVGRQPIFTPDRKVFGYEMLFRNSNANAAEIDNPEQATATVLRNTFVEFGLDQLVGDKFVFVNVSRKFLLEWQDMLFPTPRIVIEVLKDVQADEEVLASLESFRRRGYAIALDDVDGSYDRVELLKIADIIKVDLRLHESADDLAATVRRLRGYPGRLLAEKVETQEEFERCRDLGFDLFQGYFFSVPAVLSSRSLPENKATVLRLLSKLYEPDVGPADIDEVLRTDPHLSFKLLRCVNSAYFGLSVQVKSIQHAVVYLGINTIRNWVNLLMLSSFSDKPDELYRLALTRARMCELLKERLDPALRESAFTVGLFSVLDAIFDMEMKDVLAKVSLSTELQAALTNRAGQLGQLLHLVCAYERADLFYLMHSGISIGKLSSIYLEASGWAQEVFSSQLASAVQGA